MSIKVPDKYQEILSNSKNYIGMMGLSVGKPDFQDQQIMSCYCDFMQKHFLYGVFIIGDYPKKYNIMALENVSEQQAEQRTRMAGDHMRNALEKITRDFPFVKVARWKHFMNSAYTHNLNVLKDGYSNDKTFQQECNYLVWNFLSLPTNINKINNQNTITNRVDICKNYLLDELALLIATPFSFSLPVCEIYPGRNGVHEQVQERQFSFCKDLHIKDNRVFMEAYYE